MSPRLLYLLSIEHEPPSERDWIGSLTAAGRMAARRRPRWHRNALMTAR
jgi:hypothetical protein